MRKYILYICRGLLSINTLYVLAKGDFESVIILLSAILLSYVPEMLEKVMGIYLTDAMAISGVIFIMLSQWLGTYLRAYDVIAWWDVMLHGVSGIFASLVGLIIVLLSDKKQVVIQNKLYGLISWMMFLMGATSAVLWEIFEWLGDTYLGTFAQLGSLTDTMEDMVVCVIVSAVFSLIVYIGLKQSKENWITRQVHTLVALNSKKAS